MQDKKRGQYFSFDAVIATVIMVVATTSLVAYWFGVQSVAEDRANPLYADAMRIAVSLTSPGVPANWTKYDLSGVYQIGISDGFDNELNETKLIWLNNKIGNGYFNATKYQQIGKILRAPGQYRILVEKTDNNLVLFDIGNRSFFFSGSAKEVAIAHRGGSLNTGGSISVPVRIRVFLGR